MTKVSVFWGKYRFLSNFYTSPFKYKNKVYKTVEHAYQALKLADKDDREKVRLAMSPGEAKKLGRRYTSRDDFEDVKVKIMYRMVYEKFKQNEELADRLLATEEMKLVEGNTWHDNFWGDCQCMKCEIIEGQNYLGRVLMKVRKRLNTD